MAVGTSHQAEVGAVDDSQAQRDILGAHRRKLWSFVVLLILAALLSLGLTIPIVVLNERAIANGTRVYRGNVDILSEDPIFVGRRILSRNGSASVCNFYPGQWYGGTSIIVSFLAIVYGISALLSSYCSGEPIKKGGAIQVVGYVFIGVCVLVVLMAFAAFIEAIRTSVVISDPFHSDGTLNNCNFDNVSICGCGTRRIFINVPSCEYALGPLADYYNRMIALIFFSGLMPIVLAVFFGAISRLYQSTPNQPSGLTVFVTAPVQQYPMVLQPAPAALPAYGSHPTDQPPLAQAPGAVPQAAWANASAPPYVPAEKTQHNYMVDISSAGDKNPNLPPYEAV